MKNEYIIIYNYSNKKIQGIAEYGYETEGKISFENLDNLRKRLNENLKRDIDDELDFKIIILSIINLKNL